MTLPVCLILPFVVYHFAALKVRGNLRNNRKRDFCQKRKNSLGFQSFAQTTKYSIKTS